MTSAKKRLAAKRLEWVAYAHQGIFEAVGDDVMSPKFKVHSTVDPLRFTLTTQLLTPLSKHTYTPLRRYLRIWAESYGCTVQSCRITNSGIQATILIRERTWDRDFQRRPKERGIFSRRAR